MAKSERGGLGGRRGRSGSRVGSGPGGIHRNQFGGRIEPAGCVHRWGGDRHIRDQRAGADRAAGGGGGRGRVRRVRFGSPIDHEVGGPVTVAGLGVLLLPAGAYAAFPPVGRQRADALYGVEGGDAVAESVSGGCSVVGGTDRASCEAEDGVWTPTTVGVPGTGATGAHEVASLVAPGLLVAAGVVVAFVAYRVVRRLMQNVAGRP